MWDAADASSWWWVGPPVAHGPRALTAAEQAAVLRVINSTGYAELSVGQIWARELDEGRF